jgi:hypothetical protein
MEYLPDFWTNDRSLLLATRTVAILGVSVSVFRVPFVTFLTLIETTRQDEQEMSAAFRKALIDNPRVKNLQFQVEGMTIMSRLSELIGVMNRVNSRSVDIAGHLSSE